MTTTTIPTLTPLTKRAATIAAETMDAYSADRYGERGWRGMARELLKRGFTPDEAETILRSKHTRWAADACGDGDGVGRYGRLPGAKVIGRYLDEYGRDIRPGTLPASLR